jgi:hypothetical protein
MDNQQMNAANKIAKARQIQRVVVKLGTHGSQELKVKAEFPLVVGARVEVQEMTAGPWIPGCVTDIRVGVTFIDRH